MKTIKWLVIKSNKQGYGPCPLEQVIRPAEAFAELIKKETNGSINVEVLTTQSYEAKYGKKLKSVYDVLDALKNDEIQMTQVEVYELGAMDSNFYVFDMPWMFKSHEHASRVLDGQIGRAMNKRLEAHHNIKGLGYTYSGGYRSIGGFKSIPTLEDLASMKLLINGNPVTKDYMDELGIETIQNKHAEDIDARDTTYIRFKEATNFLKTKTYGTSPSNTTITVKYLVGGGVESNVKKGVLTNVSAIEYEEDTQLFTPTQLAIYNSAKTSLAVDNEIPASGGRDGETIEEIRQNALANFGSQNRAVTANDYQVRALAMPSKYGSIAKAYATADGTLDNNSPSSILSSPKALQEFTDLVMSFVEKPDSEEPDRRSVKQEIQKFLVGKTSNDNEKNNPFAINLYLLGYDSDKKLTTLNRAVKENLKTYLSEYKILTDGVNINDGFIINIGVEFEVITFKNYNKSEVIANCIQELKDYLNIDNWTFNNTINLSELELIVANVEGVSSVPKFKIVNKCGGNYSPNSYNIEAAIKDKILYPSLDPSVFEVKYPDSDIKGRAR